MKVEQNLQAKNDPTHLDVLYADLALVIPDFSYPTGFYAELNSFLFAHSHSFFDDQQQPTLLKQCLQQLSEEDADHLLTVLEGAKALIVEHQLPNMIAYNEFMIHSKENRFYTSQS